MATVTHTFVDALADRPVDAAAGKVLPSHWNAAHTVALGAETLTSLTVTQGTITADAQVISATTTWNSVGVTFTGIKYNVTNTASAAGSALFDFQLGGASRLKLLASASGELSFPDGAGISVGAFATNPGVRLLSDNIIFYSNGSITGQVSGAGAFGFVNRSDGLFKWSSVTDASSTPDTALGRNAAGIVEVNNCTAGTFRDLIVRNVVTNPTTVASLSGTTKGARSFVTDATATTFASIVAGGGANNVPVYYNGTNWCIG